MKWVVALILSALPCAGATYYVDFDAGNDANAGTSTSVPFKTLPGTRKADNSDYVSTAFGGTTFTYNATKVPAGTTFKIKRGTTLDSTKGGWTQIDSLWYQNGTAGNPITIQTDAAWGSGSVILNGTGATLPSYRGLINIDSIQYMVIDGLAASGIIVTNSPWNGIRAYGTGSNGPTLRNLEIGNSPHALVNVLSSDGSTPLYWNGVVLDGLIVHDGTGTTDTDSLIYASWLNGFSITNCVAYNSGVGADCIHVESSHEGWILNCTAHNGGEQGIDLSRNGSYKSRDDSYNLTVRGCTSYDNILNDFDHNSGTHHVYWINDIAWRTTSGNLGDSCFNLHQGSAGINFWINCTSSRASDRGFNLGFDSNPWNIPAGTNAQYFINCLSSQDTNYSIYITEGSTNKAILTALNCDLNSLSSGNAVYDGGTIYSAANVVNGTGGWTGTNCLVSDPLWLKNGTSWSSSDLHLGAGSPCLSGGTYLFTTSGSGAGSTTLVLTPVVADLDATRVFLAGDTVVIEGAGQAQAAVVASGTITLSSPMTWQAGKGVSFTGQKLIGALGGAGVARVKNAHAGGIKGR